MRSSNRLDVIICMLCILFLTQGQATLEGFFDMYRAHQLYTQGKVDATRDVLASLVAQDTQNWRSLYNLGTLELNARHYDTAIQHFEKVLELQPNNRSAQERLAIARKRKEQQEAEKEQQNKQNESPEQQQKQQDEKEQQQNASDNSAEKNQQSQQGQDKQGQNDSAENRQQQDAAGQNNAATQQKQEKEQAQAQSAASQEHSNSHEKETQEHKGISLEDIPPKDSTPQQQQLVQRAEAIDRLTQRYMIQQAHQQGGKARDATHSW